MKKRMISILIAAALLLSAPACASQSSEENPNGSDAQLGTSGTQAVTLSAEANTAYTGTVSAVSDQSITVSTDAGTVTIEWMETTSVSRGFGMGQAGSAGDTEGSAPGMEGMPQKSGPDAMEQPGGDNQMNTPSNGMSDSDVPAKPDGDGIQAGDPPEIPSGEGGMRDGNGMGEQNPDLTAADIALGDLVTVETDENGAAVRVTLFGADAGSGGTDRFGGMGGAASEVVIYDAVTEFTADASETGAAYTSTGIDENAIYVSNGAAVTLEDAAIVRQSETSTGGDNSSFYGVGAAALVTDGTLTIADSSIETDAAGGAGVFAYGSGTAYVWDTAIDTAQDTSGGIHVAGGGTLYAWDLTVETDGESSAAIRSDRGSGTMVVDGGTYISNGEGSPAIYSAADVTVHNAALTAAGSEAICIEGRNTIRLFDCDLSGDMEDLRQNDCTWNVILYQSMSGDSEVGNSTFEMVGGSLTAGNGGMFYTTNTESTFLLSGVDITYADESEFFLKCTGNANQRGWGTAGSNGANCHFTALAQAMEGDVIWDSISQLDFYILEGSTLTGAVRRDESNAGAGGNGYAALYIDSASTWIVTGDSALTTLHCAGTVADADGNTVTIVGTDGTVYVPGSSQYTVTVSAYDTSADSSGASSADSWSDYAVSRP